MVILLPFLCLISIGALISKIHILKAGCSFFLILFMWIIFGFSETPDLSNYRLIYSMASSYTPFEILTAHDIKDQGYIFLNSLFSAFGFSFEEFHSILALLWILFFVYFSRKLTHNTLIVVLFYLLWPFFIDVIQMRTMVVNLIIFISLYEYSKEENQSLIKAILLIVLASFFHRLALIFIPYFLFKKVSSYNIVKILVLIIAVLMPVYIGFVGSRLASQLNFYAYMQNDSTFSSLAQYDLVVAGFEKYARWLYVLGVMGIMKLLCTYMNKTSFSSSATALKRNFLINCFSMSMYTACFMPLYAITGAEFGRIERCFLISFIVAIAVFLENTKNNKICIFVYCSSASVLFLAGLTDLYKALGENVIQILTENSFINLFGI